MTEAEKIPRAVAPDCTPGRLGLVVLALDPPGPLILDIAVPLQAGLFPLAVLDRHSGQSPPFALADLFAWGVRATSLLGAHPQIARLPHLALPRALIRDDYHDCEGSTTG